MVEYADLAILPIVFLAYLFKASTGFGSAIVMVALGSLVVGPANAVAVVSVLDVVGGAALLRIDWRTRDSWRFWVPLVLAMAVGAAAGGALLYVIPAQAFKPLVGAGVIAAGLWMIVLRGRQGGEGRELPETAGPVDTGMCFLAGVCGGLTSLSGPPIALYFGNRFKKEALRRILTRIFLAEAVARVLAYGATGVLTKPLLVLSALSLPLVVLGLLVGNRIFRDIPERWFSRIVGAMVVISGVRLLT